MSWFKVDDGLHSHPKALAAGDTALGLWVRLGSWCGKHHTDGLIPAGAAQTLGKPAVFRRLVDVGLLEYAPGGYLMHDFTDYNPTREQVDQERKATAERVARWREQRRTNGSRNGVTNAVRNGVRTPAPTRPVGEGRPLRGLPPLEVPPRRPDLGRDVDVTREASA